MSDKKGNFVIKHSKGTAKLAGLATLTDDTMSQSQSDISPIAEHNDASGVLRTVVRDMIIDEMTCRITPGIGSGLADKAATAAAIAAVRKFDQFISSGFDFADLNWPDADKAIVYAITRTQAEGALGEATVTVRRYKTNAGVVIDFTGAWATI